MKRNIALGSICLAAFLIPLQVTAAASATIAIARDLGGGAVAISWILKAFFVALGSFVMAAVRHLQRDARRGEAAIAINA